jgi:GNAT superfamily N-acetyltransferase
MLTFGALDEADAAAVQALLESNPGYTERVSGRPPAPEDGLEVLLDGPPDLKPGQKHCVGAWLDGTLVAVADVLQSWPNEQTAHIGLLLVHGDHEGQGIGRTLHDHVLSLVRGWEGVDTLRLGIVETNAAGAEPFWSRLGYRPTGRVVPFIEGPVETTVAVWTRPLED